MIPLDLTEEEAAALVQLLTKTIDGDRSRCHRGFQILKATRAKVRLEPARKPLPPP